MFFEEKKQNEALAEIEPFLKKNPYCISLLQLKAGMLREMGKIKEADEVRQTWFGVMDSILASGDGRTPETAMQVITTAEEYSVIDVLDLRLIKQALVLKNGHNYDVMTVCKATEPENTEKTFDLYFNVDLPFASLHKMFSKEPAPSDSKK